MARTVKEEEYAARRNEILAVVKRMVFTKGLDHMTIQDILDELRISKGAFYYYFDSKAAVQGALIEQMVHEEVEPQLEAIIQDPHLSALEKLHAYFHTSARWKSERKEMILSLMRVWYSDENILFRHKLNEYALKRVTAMFAEIVRQGVREGVFNTHYPEQSGHMLIFIVQGLGERFVRLLLNAEARDWSDPHVVDTVTESIAALSDMMERILGAPKGSIHPIDPETIKIWFVPANDITEAALLKNGKEYQ